MQISCALPPGPDTVEYAVLSESLGYERVWLYDSPALYADVWVTLARVAERTSRVGLGTAVLIPNLRHPMTQAAAIATLEQLAPGRLVVALGTGFTGRMAMGQRPLTWAYMKRYIRQLRALLAGDAVEIEGAMAQMIPPPGFLPERPIKTPILIGANGPKGLAVARELGDGVMCLLAPQPGFERCAVLAFGTVLRDGEEPASERVLEAVGPAFAAFYHSQLSDALPRGAEWRKMIEQFPEETRHLKVHELHVVAINEHDRPFIDPAAAAAATLTGTTRALCDRLDVLEAGGRQSSCISPWAPTSRKSCGRSPRWPGSGSARSRRRTGCVGRSLDSKGGTYVRGDHLRGDGPGGDDYAQSPREAERAHGANDAGA